MDFNCKKIPLWLKTGLLLSVFVLGIFLLGGILGLIVNFFVFGMFGCQAPGNWGHLSPGTLELCFQAGINPFYIYSIIVLLPVLAILQNTSMANLIPSDFYLAIALVIYFIIGALIGFAWQKIKSKK